MDASTFKNSLEELMGVFYTRMDSFEDKLQKTPPTPNTEALAAEFVAFKEFIMKSLRALQCQIELLATGIDRLEMRSRRKMLLLHGLPEEGTEVTSEVVAKAVTDKLKQQTFIVEDISRCHRMGRTMSPDKPRPILCKFRNVAVRDKIWAAKSSLKGTGITVSEFLTKTRHGIFMAARERFGVAKCWTREGLVFVIGADGTRHRVSRQRELDQIAVVEATRVPATVKEVPVTAKQVPAAAQAKVKRAAARR